MKRRTFFKSVMGAIATIPLFGKTKVVATPTKQPDKDILRGSPDSSMDDAIDWFIRNTPKPQFSESFIQEAVEGMEAKFEKEIYSDNLTAQYPGITYYNTTDTYIVYNGMTTTYSSAIMDNRSILNGKF